LSDHILPGQGSLFATDALHRPDPERLKDLRSFAVKCQNCALRANRQNVVFGEGNPNRPPVVFIGEGPGALEDAAGRPFVGPVGQLLDKMILAMGLTREQVYLCFIVACRPKHSPPAPEEILACREWWVGQLRAIQPQIIVAMGATATRALLEPKKEEPILAYRKKWHTWQGLPLRVTYHPSFLILNPREKPAAWMDLQEVVKKLKSLDV
jgi:uracil-DNA glycosylase family 4